MPLGRLHMAKHNLGDLKCIVARGEIFFWKMCESFIWNALLRRILAHTNWLGLKKEFYLLLFWFYWLCVEQKTPEFRCMKSLRLLLLLLKIYCSRLQLTVWEAFGHRQNFFTHPKQTGLLV